MKILVADDDRNNRNILATMLAKWSHEVVVAKDGDEAWALFQKEAPGMAILDWMMPGLDGLTLCKKIREALQSQPFYILFLTGMVEMEDIVKGLSTGADDYLTKPFDVEELRARVNVGIRTLHLESALKERVKELEEALAHVKQLQGLLPICSYCKRVCDDQKDWHQMEAYISEHSGAQFSHCVCPECHEEILKPEVERLKLLKKANPSQSPEHP
jgi:sigma-B regulation protein RsbU (phosphoserine phosphatase)